MNFVQIGLRDQSGAAVLDNAARAASGLKQLGVEPGDVIAILMRNDFPFIEASNAAGRIGAYPVPVNWHAAPAEVAFILDNSQAKVLIAHSDLLDPIRAELPDGLAVIVVQTPGELMQAYRLPYAPLCNGDRDWSDWLAENEPLADPPLPNRGAMMYTSGTTGRPRGVMREAPTPEIVASSFDMFLTITGMRPWLDRPEEATALIAAPLYHGTPNGWAQALVPMGVNLVIEPRFDAEALLAKIEKYRVTHALLVPTMFVRLLRLPQEVRDRYDLSSLTFMMHAGAPCPVQVKRDMIDWLGPIVSEHYGSTEVGAITYCDSEQWLAHPGTVGLPLDHVRIEVVDENDRPLPPNEPGEVLCRNFGFPDFLYHHDAEKRAKAERNGLISIGDVGYLDEDGFLYLCSRSSEMIISGGANIYPAEIEGELLKLPGVADCAVFGIPDAEYGEQVCAHVQPEPGARLDPEAIRQALRETLSGFKVPRRVVVDESLPREDSGKVFKKRIRQPYWEAAGREI